MILFELDPQPGVPRQAALRRAIVAAVEAGRLPLGQALPPSRTLARRLGLARNTVTAVYEELVQRGVLKSVPRRGVFVASGGAGAAAGATQAQAGRADAGPPPDWTNHLRMRPSALRLLNRAADWQGFPFPFVYGQVDPHLFPLAAWRACSRDALGRRAVDWWAADRSSGDDPLLIEQLRRQVLPRRGILAREEEILITLGAQEGLWLAAQMLVGPGTRVGLEDPGYADIRNIVALHEAEMQPLAVDGEGLITEGKALEGLNLVVVTPNHHCPTMVTMPQKRRRQLLDWANRTGAVVLEDDYEGDLDAAPQGIASLYAQDGGRQVVHLGTFSKVLAPGVRLGYLVGPAPFIREARALRKLMHRNVPLNNQRTAALFLAEGHYEGLLKRLSSTMAERRQAARQALARELPAFSAPAHTGGSALWVTCPQGLSTPELLRAAESRGVLFEPGESFFANPQAGMGCFRLGLSSVPAEQVGEGVRRLAEAAASLGF